MAIQGLHEIFLPVSDLAKSIAFYQKLGYQCVQELPWGMAQLKGSNGSRLSLCKKSFFPQPSLGHLSDQIDQDFEQLVSQGIAITADDRQNDPARFSFMDPDGFEITVVSTTPSTSEKEHP